MEGDNTNDLYKECLRNHAANLGNYANDGCGEFTLDDTLPGALQCAACGCHRNFHRKVTNYNRDPEITTDIIDYGGGTNVRLSLERSGKKRFRTKFTADQKEKMLEFAAKLGWKLQRTDQEDEIERFCKWVGVSRKVFKVWMHNHKSSSSTSSISTGNASSLTQ